LRDEERVVKVFQFPRARFQSGAWVSLLVEKPNGKTKRLKGILLNTPIVFVQKPNGEIEDVPVGRIVEVLDYLPPKAAKKKMIKERAYRLAREMMKREQLIARYEAFILKRLREGRR